MNKLSCPFRRMCLAIFLAILMTVNALATFPDTASHWAEDAVDYWTQREVVSGYPDGNFHPDQNISRAEAAKIIARLLHLEQSAGQSFSDVPETHWAFDDIEACAANGVVTGYAGLFRPSSNITRQEAMAILYGVSKYQTEDPEAVLSAMSDEEAVAAWARTPVGVLLAAGVVVGLPDGTIGPERDISRAEFVTLLQRIDQAEMWKDFTLPLPKITWQQDNLTLTSQTIGGVSYLFLPAAADLTALELRVTEPDDAEITVTFQGDLDTAVQAPVDLTALSSPAADGSYPLTVTISKGDSVRSTELHILRSANIGAMFMTSDPDSGGRAYVEAVKGNSIKGALVMLDADGTVIYDDTLSQIKSRGNSTFTYLKKPYQIKLNKKSDLLGNGEKVKTWVLLGNYADATLFRDKLCKDIAISMEAPGTPESRWVELYFDGEYRGCYLLSEKVQVSSAGLDITDLEGMYEDENPDVYGDDATGIAARNRFGNRFYYVDGLSDPEDFSNGYLLEMSNQNGDETCWFSTSRGWALNVKSPEALSKNAMIYISELWQEFENAVYAVDQYGNNTGINPETGKSYTEYCDVDSLARMYLVYFFSNNQDAYALSTFYYKEGGMLHAGPVWDGDQTFGISWMGPASPESELRMHYLIEALEKIPSFQAAVKAVYQSEFRAIAEYYAQEGIQRYAATLSASERMNHLLWPDYFSASGLYQVYPAGTTYQQIVSETAQWMLDRLSYMDRKFQNWTQDIPEGPVPQTPGPEQQDPSDTPDMPEGTDTLETPVSGLPDTEPSSEASIPTASEPTDSTAA